MDVKNKWRGACGSRSWSFFSAERWYIPLTGGRSAKEPLALQSSLWSVTGVFQNLARLSATGAISAYSRTNENEACEKIISENPSRSLRSFGCATKVKLTPPKKVLQYLFYFVATISDK
jgi:hypothetical protein